MDETNLKKIVGLFLKVNPNEINDVTIIDTSVLQGSVLFHRMISKINDLFQINLVGGNIHTYSDLINEIERYI